MITKFENIPLEIYKLINNLQKANKYEHRLMRELKQNEEKVMLAIDKLFMQASSITGFSPSVLVKNADFSYKDLDSDRFDAMIAEIRTVVHLYNLGFSDIKPLRAPNGKKESDLIACNENEKWVIEVMCSSFTSNRWTSDEICDYIIKRFSLDGKESQLTVSQDKYLCTRQMLVIVMNSRRGIALNARDDFMNILKKAWIELGSRDRFYLSIVTGRETLGHGWYRQHKVQKKRQYNVTIFGNVMSEIPAT